MSAAESVTDTALEKYGLQDPPLHWIEAVGGTESIRTVCVLIASRFPALSIARYLIVVVWSTLNVPAYVEPWVAVGSLPSVV